MLSEQPPRALHKDDDEYIYATTSCNSNEYTYEGFYAETSVEVNRYILHVLKHDPEPHDCLLYSPLDQVLKTITVF